MPLKEYQTSSYSELLGLLEKTQGDGEEIFLFFSCTLDKHGDPTTKTCFEAEDVLMEFTEFIRTSKRKLHLFYYRVLLEEYFKPDYEVRKDRNLRITTVPTLLKWKSYQRLSGSQCSKFYLISMLFEAECPKKFPVFQPCTFFTPKEKVEVPEVEGTDQPETTNASKGSLKTPSNTKDAKEEADKPPEPDKAPDAGKPPVQESAGDGHNLKTPSGPKLQTEDAAEVVTAVKDGASSPQKE